MSEEEKKSYEVTQMESLKSSTGWKMVVDKLKEKIKEQQDIINEKEPSGLTQEEKLLRYEWIVRSKDLIEEVKQFELIPDIIIQEFTNEDFVTKLS